MTIAAGPSSSTRVLKPVQQAWCVDIDGTLVRFGTPIDGSHHFLNELYACNTPFVIVSNTGTKTREDVSERLHDILGHRIEPRRIFTSCDAMLARMTEHSEFDRFVVDAPESVMQRLRDESRTVCSLLNDEGVAVDHQDRVCLALFFDGHLDDYHGKLQRAVNLVARGAVVWVTSLDTALVLQNGALQPGPGAFVSALRCVVPAVCVVSFGKDGAALKIDAIIEELHSQGFSGAMDEIIVVGDRFDSDMKFGIRNGLQTCLVESGCDRADSRHHLSREIDLVAGSVGDLRVETLKELSQRRAESQRVWLSETLLRLSRSTMRRTIRTLLASSNTIANLCEMAESRLARPPRRIQSMPARLCDLE